MTEMFYELYNNQNTEIDKIDQLDTVSLKKIGRRNQIYR